MDKLEKLRADLAAIDSQIDAFLTNESLTAEQQADHDRLVGERKTTRAAITREEDRLSREDDRETLAAASVAIAERTRRRQLVATVGAIGGDAPGSGRLTDTDAPRPHGDPPANREREQARRGIIPAQARRYGTLRHFHGERDGFRADQRAYRFGMFMLAQMVMDLPGRFNPRRTAWANDVMRFYDANWSPEPYAINLSNDGTGAQFLIPDEFSMDMIDLREQYGLVRRLFRREPMTSDRKVIPRRLGGLTAYPIGEGAAGTESTKTWNQVGLTAKDWMVLTRFSSQVNADAAINIGDDLAGECSYAFTYAEDNAGINGDGTSTYAGITGVRAKLTGTGTAGVVTQATSNTWSALVLGDFNNLIAKLPLYADQQSPVWVCHKAFYAGVMQKLELAAGGNTIREIAAGDRSFRPMFLGYPVEFSQVMPAVTAVATLSCLLGSFTLGAAFGDRQVDSVSFSEEANVGGQSLWERNEIGCRATERFDINVHDAGDATNAGPIVGLKTGA